MEFISELKKHIDVVEDKVSFFLCRKRWRRKRLDSWRVFAERNRRNEIKPSRRKAATPKSLSDRFFIVCFSKSIGFLLVLTGFLYKEVRFYFMFESLSTYQKHRDGIGSQMRIRFLSCWQTELYMCLLLRYLSIRMQEQVLAY